MVAGVALDLVGIGVDGEDFVAPVPEPLVDDVRCVILGVTDTPATATRSDARNAVAASLMVVMAMPPFAQILRGGALARRAPSGRHGSWSYGALASGGA